MHCQQIKGNTFQMLICRWNICKTSDMFSQQNIQTLLKEIPVRTKTNTEIALNFGSVAINIEHLRANSWYGESFTLQNYLIF